MHIFMDRMTTFPECMELASVLVIVVVGGNI